MIRAGGGASGPPRRLFTYSLGFLRQARVRRVLSLAGWQVTTGWPGIGDAVGVWGRKPVSRRGEAVAKRSGAGLITIEDGFLRSLYPGVTGALPLSLIIDDVGIYYDAKSPSRLEMILAETDLSPADAARARDGWAALRAARLSKYTPPVQPVTTFRDHVLVVDQTAGDASIRGAGAGPETFQKMLAAARAENPGSQIVVKIHPDVMAGRKTGHFRKEDLRADEVLLATDINPWDLVENARAIYTISSQIGYEAALAERPVRCFGSAFYAGWGLTQDEAPCERRDRTLSPDELFAGCHLRYPVYYDPFHDRLGTF
ncbi:MAG: capsular polysaccharide biosynthesis protein, partial [Pseudomonadota bacterium]